MKYVMSQVSMSHVTPRMRHVALWEELCHTRSWWNTSCRRFQWVISPLAWVILHCGRSHLTHVEWVMAYTYSQWNESCRTFQEEGNTPPMSHITHVGWDMSHSQRMKTSHVTPRMSHVTPRMSHVTPRMSNITPRMSHVTPRMRHVTFTAEDTRCRFRGATQGRRNRTWNATNSSFRETHS